MEKISFNKERKPHNIKEWAKRLFKIGAIAGVSLFPMKSEKATSEGIEKMPIEKMKIFSQPDLSPKELLNSPEYMETISSINEIVFDAKRNISNAGKEIAAMRAREGYNKDLDEEYLNKKIEKRLEDIEYCQQIIREYSDAKEKLLSELNIEYKTARANYEDQRAWLNKMMDSKAYLEKLNNEFKNKNEPIVKAEIKIRELRKKLLNREYEIHIGNQVNDSTIGQSSVLRGVELPSNPRDEYKNAGIHEFTHQSTWGNILMSEKAKGLYVESFDETHLSEAEKKMVRYYKNATERDARKKVLEYDMENLGIKKYGEKFTNEHYLKLLKIQKSGKLSADSEEFLRMTKPEYMEKVMNEIAENSNSPEESNKV